MNLDVVASAYQQSCHYYRFAHFHSGKGKQKEKETEGERESCNIGYAYVNIPQLWPGTICLKDPVIPQKQNKNYCNYYRSIMQVKEH